MTKKTPVRLVMSSLFATVLGVAASASAVTQGALFWDGDAVQGDAFYNCSNRLIYAQGTGYNGSGNVVCSARSYNVSIWVYSNCAGGVTHRASLRSEGGNIYCVASPSAGFNGGATGCGASVSTKKNVTTAACVPRGPTAFSIGNP
jgi:hypothetical protein